MEEQITNAMTRIQKEQTGRGADQGKTCIINDMVIVRLKGVLTPTERNLINTPDGRRLIKQLRNFMEDAQRKDIESVIQNITGKKVISIHHDISAKTGEKLDVFILDSSFEDNHIN